jgi:hypothetical protein
MRRAVAGYDAGIVADIFSGKVQFLDLSGVIARRHTLAVTIKQKSVFVIKSKMDGLSDMGARHFWRKSNDQGFIVGVMACVQQKALTQKFETIGYT